MSEVDQEVLPQNDAASTASDDGSAAGPILTAHVRANFLDIVPKNAKTYSGIVDTMTFNEWMEHTSLWIDHL